MYVCVGLCVIYGAKFVWEGTHITFWLTEECECSHMQEICQPHCACCYPFAGSIDCMCAAYVCVCVLHVSVCVLRSGVSSFYSHK